MAKAALPLFHLYGDPPGAQAFDFIHVETIAARSVPHDWTIRAHRHRDLFQVLLIAEGGGEMSYETAKIEADGRFHGFVDQKAVTVQAHFVPPIGYGECVSAERPLQH